MVKKKLHSSAIALLVFIVVVLIFLGIGIKIAQKLQTNSAPTSPTSSQSADPFDFANQTISLDGQKLTFKNGQYQHTYPPSGQRITKIIPQEMNSTKTRGASIIIDNPGGSGTLYYLIGAMMKGNTKIYSAPVLLGDRIILGRVSVSDDGIISAQFLDHGKNEPIASQPTQKIVKKFTFQDDGNLKSM